MFKMGHQIKELGTLGIQSSTHLCLEVGMVAVIEQQKVESIGMPSEEHMARTVPKGWEAQARPGQHQTDGHHDHPLTACLRAHGVPHWSSKS